MADLITVGSRGDGCVVLHVPTGTYLHLDAVAAAIVTSAHEGGPSSAFAMLQARYGLSAEAARKDVMSVLSAVRQTRARRRSTFRRPTIRGLGAVTEAWRRATFAERRCLAAMSLLMAATELGLRCLNLRRVCRMLGVPLETGRPTGPPLPKWPLDKASERERQNLRVFGWVLRSWSWDATCLRRALGMGFILRQHQPNLCLGELPSGELHAWLWLEGATVNAIDASTDALPET